MYGYKAQPCPTKREGHACTQRMYQRQDCVRESISSPESLLQGLALRKARNCLCAPTRRTNTRPHKIEVANLICLLTPLIPNLTGGKRQQLKQHAKSELLCHPKETNARKKPHLLVRLCMPSCRVSTNDRTNVLSHFRPNSAFSPPMRRVAHEFPYVSITEQALCADRNKVGAWRAKSDNQSTNTL